MEIEKLQQELASLKLERDQAVEKSQKLEKENAQLKSTTSTTSNSNSNSNSTNYSSLIPEGDKIPCSSKTPYSDRVDIKKVLKQGKALIGKKITVAGWAYSIREGDGGKMLFVVLNDGSSYNTLQVIVDAGIAGFADVGGVNSGKGACIRATGQIVACIEGQEQEIELRAEEVELVGKCVPGNYPLASKQRMSVEALRALLHLRVRTNTFSAMSRVRNACTMATHLFFQQQGFVNLHTPLITASDCEGAGEMFQITTLLKNGSAKLSDVKLVKETGKPDYSEDFFGKPAFLTVSGQLNGEMYACGLGKIYTFGPTFRAEDSHTSRHIAEFWMIEPEVAFNDLDDNMDLAEAYLKFVINFVLDTCPEDMKFFDKFVSKEKGLIQRLKDTSSKPFKRLTYTEAVDILLKVTPKQKKFDVKVEWGIDLKSEHERYLAEVVFKQPIILTDYPKDIKAFYMRLNEDGKTVRAMDMLVPGIGELIGGSQREERLEVLEKRLEECKLDKEAYKYYLDLRRFGSCPHSGFGLGFERLVMFVTGIENIRDCIPFPRWPKHAEF